MNDRRMMRELLDASLPGRPDRHSALTEGLILAAKLGLTETMSLLIERGANVNAETFGGGWTALLTAAAWGQIEAVRLLIRHGANVNARTKPGDTALTWAQGRGDTDLCDLLRKAGGTV